MSRYQRGATLIVALVFLLIITILAMSSIRRAILEARITGNVIEQKKIFNASESGLREPEYRLALLASAPEQCETGEDDEQTPLNSFCIVASDPSYGFDFSDSRNYTGTDGATRLEHATRWYALNVDSGGLEGETENPEYGNMMQGIGTFYYEINSQAGSNQNPTTLRSVVARLFNN